MGTILANGVRPTRLIRHLVFCTVCFIFLHKFLPQVDATRRLQYEFYGSKEQKDKDLILVARSIDLCTCLNIPLEGVKDVVSVNTNEQCLKMYTRRNCQGNKVRVTTYKSTPASGGWGQKHWAGGKVASIRSCHSNPNECRAVVKSNFAAAIDNDLSISMPSLGEYRPKGRLPASILVGTPFHRPSAQACALIRRWCDPHFNCARQYQLGLGGWDFVVNGVAAKSWQEWSCVLDGGGYILGLVQS